MSHSKGLLVATVISLLLAGCGGTSDSNDGADANRPSTDQMPDMQHGDAAEHTAEGTVNSVDKTAGTVNISHGPVESANWPGMTMNFKLADPKMADGLKPGQRLKFSFTIQGGMDATVTQITPAE